METVPEGKLRIIPIGGVGEIGKNMYAYQVRDQILVVDCGLKFPDEEMYGVDVVIPDVRWLVENNRRARLRAAAAQRAGLWNTARAGSGEGTTGRAAAPRRCHPA